MRNDTKQAIKNIAQILEISEKYVRYDDREKVYVIENCVSENSLEVIKFNKDIQFDDLLDYPLKFHKCEFLESVIGYEKQFRHKLIFTNVTFKKILNLAFSIFSNEINFFNATLEESIDCRQCEFKGAFKAFGVMFLKRAIFENSTFEKEVHFGKEIDDRNTEKSNMFGSCSFETAFFENCNFFDSVYFKNNEFKQLFFKNSIFKDNVYFNNSHFYDFADFHECEFEKTACFYGATFHNKAILNFSQAIFKENLNFVNVKCDFEFKDLKDTIENDDKTLSSKVANDFRDSFRLIKNALVKDNNLLDASNFHKYELYCKEIELDSKNPKMLKDKIDKLQLCFYRKLCNHHTDLILNLKWLMITIGLFTILFFASKIIQGKEIWNLNHYGIALSASSCIMIVLLCLFDYLKLLGGFAYLNLVATLWLVCYNPKLIFGVVNILGDSCFNSFENIVMVTYTIMMFLVVFSLQKTARKNSIIPH